MRTVGIAWLGSRCSLVLILVALMAGSALLCHADPILLDFENLPDAYLFSAGGQNIGSLYPGVTFGPYVTGLSVSRFGGFLDAAFPPHSGDVVVWSAFDDAMTLSFSSATSMVGFWYTSLNPITITAFDSGGNTLGSVSGNANTDGTTGTSSFLSFDATGIAFVAISSAAGQYVVDDVTFNAGTAAVPEPSPVSLLVTCCLLVAFKCRRYSPTKMNTPGATHCRK